MPKLLSKENFKAPDWSKVVQRNVPTVKKLSRNNERDKAKRPKKDNKGKRENNVITHGLTGSKKDTANEKAEEDLSLINKLTTKELKLGDLLALKAGILGNTNNRDGVKNDNRGQNNNDMGGGSDKNNGEGTKSDNGGSSKKSRTLKIVLPTKEKRHLMFQNFKKRKKANDKFNPFCLAYDFLRDEELKTKTASNRKHQKQR